MTGVNETRQLHINTVKSFMRGDKGPFALLSSRRRRETVKDPINLNRIRDRDLDQMLGDIEGWYVENGYFFYQGRVLVFTDLLKLQRRAMHSLLIIERNLTIKDNYKN